MHKRSLMSYMACTGRTSPLSGGRKHPLEDRSSIFDLRSSIFDLRPSTLQTEGFPFALRGISPLGSKNRLGSSPQISGFSLHPAAVRCDMALHQALRARRERRNGIGAEVRHDVTSGVSRETSLRKYVYLLNKSKNQPTHV